nr:uncharacterized protein LOC128699041 [Cherax quadricarinatus]XP_053656619.1 uncharacterized protein LOC128705476 [Cherax quadricarinatus]
MALTLQMKNYLECGMCPEGVNDRTTRRLSCGHPVCVPCLAALFRASNTVCCPVCNIIHWRIGPYDNRVVPKNCLRVWKVKGSNSLRTDPLHKREDGRFNMRREAMVSFILSSFESDRDLNVYRNAQGIFELFYM